MCECVKGKLAGDKASWGSSGYKIHGFMGYKKSFLFYFIVNGENYGETGEQALPLAFSEEL